MDAGGTWFRVSGCRFDADVIAAGVPVCHTRLDFSPSAR
jgi:hypothetical protein